MSKYFLFRDAQLSDVEKMIVPLNQEKMLKSREDQLYSKEELESIIIDNEMNLVLVAEAHLIKETQGDMAGFVIADLIKRRDFRYADINGIYVFEGYRKSGIMKKLISHFEEKAKEKGCSYVHGCVRIKNHSAQRGFRKLGYVFGNRFIDISKELK